nr:3-hydroxyacyl-CoA dehydrogenase NAD-binding domain-containing protein [Microvirga antarctica]
MERGPRPDASGSVWENWRMALDSNGVAWLTLDKKDASANTLSEDVMRELDGILAGLERNPPKGLVIRSAKESGFIAGADINQFKGVTDAEAVKAALRFGHAVVDRLEALPVPTIAVIHGYCLGGGLEIALACKYRIARNDASLGFPEILLGLHPGLGGTARATTLIDPVEAMTMMLTGKSVHAKKAKALGLVDAVTEERHIATAVAAVVKGEIPSAHQGLRARVFDLGPTRALLAKRMRAEADKKAPPAHYPAPGALIDLWENFGGDRRRMKQEEIESFARLLLTDTAQNLIRVFFLREHLKSLAVKGTPPAHVHVIGAGVMGGDIAAWCAWRGMNVTLADMKAEPLGKAVKRAAELYGKIGHSSIAIRDALDRLVPDLHGDGVKGADIVIEAVPENADLKHRIYADVQARMKPGAILATNTSSIPLETLRAGLLHPDRFVGLHFFNPVSRMQLIEVVAHDGVGEDALKAARSFAGHLDRLPASVKSAPGFLVNRALTPYLLGAMLMLGEGTPKETIDAAATQFGMPVGPIELADQVGLDICLEVGEMLKRELDQPMPEAPAFLREKVKAGDLGRKTGQGLYPWKDGQAVKASDTPPPSPEMADRLILPLLNTCVAILREGVAPDEETIDGGMIFGTGFAPFRGGPLAYARARGFESVKQALEALQAKYGERFRPDPGWDTLS